jgi:exopolyphosphatase / guanosine-5'-triphosphate,3'-diphosphate pyrophosphatase
VTNKRASIDIGSNSVLLLIAQVEPFVEFEKLSEVTALGRDLDKTNHFHVDSMKDTYDALLKYRDLCLKYEIAPSNIIATATEASRVAKNAREFFVKVKSELGIDVKIIRADEEARLTTKGILFNTTFDEEEIVVMDIGGASTELIKVRIDNFQILDSISLKVGSVRVTDWIRDGHFANALSKLLADNSQKLDYFQTKTLYCVAGTLTSMGNMFLENQEYIESEVHGLELKKIDIEKMFQKYSNWKPEQLLEKFPFLGKRANAIAGGISLTTHLLQRLKVERVVVSTYGLRYGTFLEGVNDGPSSR